MQLEAKFLSTLIYGLRLFTPTKGTVRYLLPHVLSRTVHTLVYSTVTALLFLWATMDDAAPYLLYPHSDVLRLCRNIVQVPDWIEKDTRISYIGRGKPGTRLKEFDVEEPPLSLALPRGSARVGDSYSPTPKKETLFSFSFILTLEAPTMCRYFFYTCKLEQPCIVIIILDSSIIATKLASNLTLPYLSLFWRSDARPSCPPIPCLWEKQNMKIMRLQTHVDAAFKEDEILLPFRY